MEVPKSFKAQCVPESTQFKLREVSIGQCNCYNPYHFWDRSLFRVFELHCSSARHVCIFDRVCKTSPKIGPCECAEALKPVSATRDMPECLRKHPVIAHRGASLFAQATQGSLAVWFLRGLSFQVAVTVRSFIPLMSEWQIKLFCSDSPSETTSICNRSAVLSGRPFGPTSGSVFKVLWCHLSPKHQCLCWKLTDMKDRRSFQMWNLIVTSVLPQPSWTIFSKQRNQTGDFKRLERRLYVRSSRRRALQLTLCSVKDCHFQPLPNTKHINWYFYLQLSDATIDVCLHSVHTSLCLWLCLGGEVVAVGKDTRVLRRQAHVSRPPLTSQPPFSAGARSRIRLLPSLLLLLYARLRCTVSV